MSTVTLSPDNAIAHGAPSAMGNGAAVVAIAHSALVGGAVAFSQQESIAMSTVNVNSNVQFAISELLAQAGATASARFALIAAKQADQSATGNVWAYMLTLAGAGADEATMRKAGSVLRAAVTRQLRVAAGLPPVKAKGSKESGAPDYSTASVYAGIVADCLAAKRDDKAAYDQAIDDATPEGGAMAIDVDSGIPAAVRDAMRVVKAHKALQDAKLSALFPSEARAAENPDAALARVTVERNALADKLATSEEEIKALRAQLAQATARSDA